MTNENAGQSELLRSIERLEAAEAALDEKIRQAHAVTKDLHLERRAAEAALEQLHKTAQEAAQTIVNREVQPLLDQMTADLSQQFNDAVDTAKREALKAIRAEINQVWKDRNGVDLRDVIGSWQAILPTVPGIAGKKNTKRS